MNVRPQGYNPMRWNCEARGCYNVKHRPKIEVFADVWPGRISMGDVDGIVEIAGNALMLEWKTATTNIPTGALAEKWILRPDVAPCVFTPSRWAAAC